MTKILSAALGGVAATAPMSVVMLAFHQALPKRDQYALPPEIITARASEKAGLAEELPRREDKQAATVVAHFGYGAVAGAGYAAVAGATGLPAAASGALYGLAVWGASYLSLMPATGLYPSAKDEPASRNAMMIAAHLVWGASLGVFFEKLSDDTR